jgi:cytochrome c oxidase subunit 2
MGVNQPERIWWKPIGKQEKIWMWVSTVFVIILFISMPLWHIFGEQNTPLISYRVSPEKFQSVIDEFVSIYQVGEENGIPIVHPPEGDVYLMARRYQWYPILELEAGKKYNIHTSSVDVDHGFSIQPINMNFEVIPGYDYVITLTPPEAGDFVILCNEYCGIGHHEMSGKMIVVEP